jgi:nucleoside-triphosphatase THEP1
VREPFAGILTRVMRVRLIHGEIGSGKTRRASAWVEFEGLAGRTVAGVLALKAPTGRRFLDIATGDEVALEHPAEDEVAVPVGRFQFRQAAFDWAVDRIGQSLGQAGSIVIDEVGPLELGGAGFAPLLDRLADDHPGIQRVLLVRTGLIDAVADRFCRSATIIFEPARNP